MVTNSVQSSTTVSSMTVPNLHVCSSYIQVYSQWNSIMLPSSSSSSFVSSYVFPFFLISWVAHSFSSFLREFYLFYKHIHEHFFWGYFFFPSLKLCCQENNFASVPQDEHSYLSIFPIFKQASQGWRCLLPEARLGWQSYGSSALCLGISIPSCTGYSADGMAEEEVQFLHPTYYVRTDVFSLLRY